MSARISGPMRRMLEDIRDGLGTHGTATGPGNHGARYATAKALRARGLLDGVDLTPAALEILKEKK